MSTLKAIKSHFKQSYDKQNLTLVVISYEIYEFMKARLINFIWNGHSCKILYIWSVVRDLTGPGECSCGLYICQAKYDCVSFDLYGHPYGVCTCYVKLPTVSYGYLMVSPCLKIMHAKLSDFMGSKYSYAGSKYSNRGSKYSKDRANPHDM